MTDKKRLPSKIEDDHGLQDIQTSGRSGDDSTTGSSDLLGWELDEGQRAQDSADENREESASALPEDGFGSLAREGGESAGDSPESAADLTDSDSTGSGDPYVLLPEHLRLEAKIEAIIFASPKPLRATEIYEVLQSYREQDEAPPRVVLPLRSTATAADLSTDEENESDHDLGHDLADDTPGDADNAGFDLDNPNKNTSEDFSQEAFADHHEHLEKPQEAAKSTEITLKDVQEAVEGLVEHYRNRCGGFHLAYIKRMGYQFQTVPAAAPLMEKQFSKRPRPISRAALETLSIIAYRQPATRAEIEYIRGVDAGSIIHGLMERNLITCTGRKEIAGRPMLFGTTDEFLKIFQLGSVKDLPSLESFQPSSDALREALAKLDNMPDELSGEDDRSVVGEVGDDLDVAEANAPIVNASAVDVEEFIGDQHYVPGVKTMGAEAAIDFGTGAIIALDEEAKAAALAAFDAEDIGHQHGQESKDEDSEQTRPEDSNQQEDPSESEDDSVLRADQAGKAKAGDDDLPL